MKRITVMTGLLACCLFFVNSYGQEGQQGGSDRTAGKGRERAAGTAHPATRVGAMSGLSGTVVAVDAGGRTFSLKERGNVVGFDASNPALTGYRTLSDMQVGDRVAVSYTAMGIKVAKLGGRRENAPEKEAGLQRQSDQVPPAGKRIKGVTKILKRAKKGSGESFDDVDANKDGKISPVELSTVIKDITMDQFRKYDKKHLGYLDKEEFKDAMRQYRSGKEK